MQTLTHIGHIIRTWPATSRRLARIMVERYGMPHEATDSLLIWHYNSPWKRTILYRDGVPHHFPASHIDQLEQTIEYRVPPEKCSELTSFDGSLVVDRTRGELSAHCDSEEANTLLLNLAHEIVIGKKTVPEARKIHAQAVKGYRLNWPEPYAKQLQFSTASMFRDREEPTSDPDRSAPKWFS